MNDAEYEDNNSIVFSEPYVSIEPLTRETATELTRSIRDAAEVIWVLIARAHAGKAWKALGYSNWAEYVNDEFNMSRSRSYQILDQAKVIAAINEATPQGAELSVSESSARDLKYVIQEAVPEIKEKTQGLPPEEAVAVTQEIIAKYENKQSDPEDEEAALPETLNSDSKLAGNIETESFPTEGSALAAEVEAEVELNNQYDAQNEEESTLAVNTPEVPPKPTMSQEELAAIRQSVNAAHDIYTALSALSSLPEDLEAIIKIIPEERKQTVSKNLEIAESKLSYFAELWKSIYKEDDEVSN
jgi:hypothetical protein